MRKKSYKLFGLDSSSVFFSMDVKFYEDVFPFKMKKKLNDDALLSSVFDESIKTNPIHSSSYDDIMNSSFMDEIPESGSPVMSH